MLVEKDGFKFEIDKDSNNYNLYERAGFKPVEEVQEDLKEEFVENEEIQQVEEQKKPKRGKKEGE